MSELNPNTSGLSQTTVARPPQDQDDPLAHLHKMSTTAGLGSGDYVAISGVAVTSVLVGLASTFAILSPILLILPVLGTILGIVALRTIANSNGTQTGRGLATLGLLLSLGFAGYAGFAEISDVMQVRAERQAISDLVEKLEVNVKASNWDEAHQLFNDHFKGLFPKDIFAQRWQYLQTHPFYGGMQDIRWNGNNIVFEKLAEEKSLAALAMVVMKFEKTSNEQNAEMLFRKKDGRWLIHSFPLFFPPPQDVPDATPPGR